MMGMQLIMRQVMICRTCKTNRADKDEHNPECPQARIAAAIAANPVWSCPRCPGRVELTLDDYLQCRRCRRMFCTGYVAAGHNPDTLESVYIKQLQPTEDYIKVLIIPVRSKKHNFRIDYAIKQLKSVEKAWKAANVR